MNEAMNVETELAQIVFLGNPSQLERHKYLLRKAIPHKIYFLDAAESEDDDEMRKISEEMREELESELPKWVSDKSEYIRIPYFSFEDAFPELIKIIQKEKRIGREVYINSHGGSILLSTAALLAANITGANIYWIDPATWRFKKEGDDVTGHMPVGASAAKEIGIPIGMALPEEPDNHVLRYVHENDGTVNGRLATIADDLGYEHLGENINKKSSAVVKLSKSLSRLRDTGLVETQKKGRKSFEIRLKGDKGRVVGEVVSLLHQS